VDPNGGSIANAIQAYRCKDMKSTCINAKTAKFATKSYVTQQLYNQPFVAKHMGTTLVSVYLVSTMTVLVLLENIQ